MSVQEAPAPPGRFLTKLTVIAPLGGLLFGYGTGVISGALLFPGAACGALFGGRVADRIGRNRTSLEQLEERLEADGADPLYERTSV